MYVVTNITDPKDICGKLFPCEEYLLTASIQI